MNNLTDDLQIDIVISATPSLNVLKGRWAMLNWKKKYLKELQNYEYLSLKYKWLQKKEKRGLIIQRFGHRILDTDNYHGGAAPLINAIKEKKLIWDDSERWVKIVYLSQVKIPFDQQEITKVIILNLKGRSK